VSACCTCTRGSLWLLVSGLWTFYNFNVMRRWVFARAERRLGSASA
jgi:hypothetical protein